MTRRVAYFSAVGEWLMKSSISTTNYNGEKNIQEPFGFLTQKTDPVCALKGQRWKMNKYVYI